MKSSFRTREQPQHRRLRSGFMVGVQNASSGVLPRLHRAVSVTPLLGLQFNRPFHRDPAFLLLLALGPIASCSMIGLFVFQPLVWSAIWSAAFFSVALWQLVLEELLFCGIIQEYTRQSVVMPKTWNGLSLSNFLTSLLFTLAHLATHSISRSLLVFVPSLCFGFVRDRFGSACPSIAPHAF